MKRYAFWLKALVFLLAVVLLLGAAAGGFGVLVAENFNIYSAADYESWLNNKNSEWTRELAYQVLKEYGASLSDCPRWLLEETGYANAIETAEGWFHLKSEEWYYSICKADGTVIKDNRPVDNTQSVFSFSHACDLYYPVLAGEESENVEIFYNPNSGENVGVSYVEVPNLMVQLWFNREIVNPYFHDYDATLICLLFQLRYVLIAATGICLLLFAAAFVYLMYAAGRDSKTGEVRLKGLNRLPLDLYGCAAVLILITGAAAIDQGLNTLNYPAFFVLLLLAIIFGGTVIMASALGFFVAFAAQMKMKGNYWWHNSITGRLWKWCWKAIRFVCRGVVKLFEMIPVIWEWLLVGAVLGIGLIIAFAASREFPILLLWWCGVGVFVVGYGGYCFGTIRKGIRRMKEGDLNEKIDTGNMVGSFKAIGEDLNALADVVSVAAEKQLKSERMKTELITNVSHDIKTPLTSLINYVDLLQQPHTEEEGAQYLEVLSRQSQRLKKLVEDLMDMSKVSTGNMTVNAVRMDAVEAVNQALGEFADKLENARLTPVFRSTMPQMPILADGRLTWRVLSNLLSNVVKYALPGTRVYCDLTQAEHRVVFSMKNISREALNISAEELTERFVRGDTSRNTEGSGLGLNIAQSLMALQHGSLELTVDGDLFKVTLAFPTE